MNAYAHLKRHSLEMERLNRMEVRCSPVRLVRGGFHRFMHHLSMATCACQI